VKKPSPLPTSAKTMPGRKPASSKIFSGLNQLRLVTSSKENPPWQLKQLASSFSNSFSLYYTLNLLLVALAIE
jgi:hypothetical protein